MGLDDVKIYKVEGGIVLSFLSAGNEGEVHGKRCS